jgi:hypothetical protein
MKRRPVQLHDDFDEPRANPYSRHRDYPPLGEYDSDEESGLHTHAGRVLLPHHAHPIRL